MTSKLKVSPTYVEVHEGLIVAIMHLVCNYRVSCLQVPICFLTPAAGYYLKRCHWGIFYIHTENQGFKFGVNGVFPEFRKQNKISFPVCYVHV